MTVSGRGTLPLGNRLVGACLVAVLAGCAGRGPAVSPADPPAALAAVAGPLPEGLEILFFEPRGGAAASWIVRVPGGWRPHAAADHRHVTLPVDSFMNLVAATAHGKVDPGRPAESSCRYTEWTLDEGAGGSRRLVRVFQLNTDQGEVTVLERLPDPTAG